MLVYRHSCWRLVRTIELIVARCKIVQFNNTWDWINMITGFSYISFGGWRFLKKSPTISILDRLDDYGPMFDDVWQVHRPIIHFLE